MSKRFRISIPKVLLVFFLTLVSYGQTLLMYFWQDDSALIFKLQHQMEAAGSFGVGLWERSPYQYLVVPFVPFFPFFKLEPFGYFLIGFLLYLLVAVVLYFMAKELLKNDLAALMVVIIFSSGYIGSDIMFRVINSWQTNIGLILSIITSYFYIKFFNTKNYKNYFLSLLFFFLTIELVYIRSHSFIFVIFAIEMFFIIKNINLRNLVYSFFRQLPFWALFYKWYLAGESIGSNGLSVFAKNFVGGKFEVITPLFATLGNAIVPDYIQDKLISKFAGHVHLYTFILLFLLSMLIFIFLYKSSKKLIFLFSISLILIFIINKYFINLNLHWYRDNYSRIGGLIGFWSLIFTIFSYFSLYKKHFKFAIGICLGFVILLSQIFGYFLQYPESIFSSTHRYLSNPFIGYCLFFGSIFYVWFKRFNRNKLISIFPFVLLVVLNLYHGFVYQNHILTDRSFPARQFYKKLTNYVPNIEKGSVFYFDIARNPYYEKQFNDFFSVGSMPETTALAIYYGVDRYDLSMYTDFDEMISFVSKTNLDVNKIYTFYYGENGLIDTTAINRDSLSKGGLTINLEANKNSINPKGISSATPKILDVTIKFSKPSDPKFPYSFSRNLYGNFSTEEKLKMLKYQTAKNGYYSNLDVSSLSEWKYGEILKAVDNNVETAWQSHRTRWNTIKDDNITVDLKSTKNINRVFWVNNRNTLTPTNYKILTSIDGVNWTLVKTVQDGPEKKNGEIVIEEFDSINARFVKMQITKTLTDDSPSISEFEVVETEYDIDPFKVFEFINNPFGDIQNINEWNSIYTAFSQLATMQLKIVTDKNKQGLTLSSKIFIDDKAHNYQIILPASGTQLKNIEIMLNFPVDVEIEKSSVKNLTIKELQDRKLIKEFAIN